jgi:ribosomal protein L22
MADEPENVEETEAPAEPAAEEAPAKKPARRSRAKKTERPVAEAAAEEAEAEEKPKPARRSRAKKAEPVAEKADEPAAKPEPKSRSAANGRVPVVRAQAKYVRTSARKARLVCDHIRGKSVDEARAILAHTPRHVARDWTKLLESAVANAEHNHELIGDDLRVAFVSADEGPTLKRFRPRAMGRATPIRKRTSHLTIGLSPKEH